MSQGPPVDASSLPPTPASASIARLAPETLAEILAFAVYTERSDDELEVYHEVVSAKTLKRITLVSKLWRDCAKPLHFQTLRFTYIVNKPCKALRPFQLDPSLTNHVHSLRLSISSAASKFNTTENYAPLMDWMGSLKNLTYLRLYVGGEIPRASYAAWPLDAFPRVETLYSNTEADSFFNQALISRMPNLEALFLATDGYHSNPETAAQHLVAVDALPNSRCLTQLFFFKGDITSSAFRHLVQTSGATLEVLEVYKAYTIDDEDLAFAIDVAPNLKRLQWCNEKYHQMGAFHDTVTPHPPALLRALSTSHITDLNIRPWPTLDVLDAFPDTLVKLELGSVLTYPGRRPNWNIGREPDYTLGQEAKQLQNDTYKAVLDARSAGRFSKLEKCFDVMGQLIEMDAGLKDRAAREGLAWYRGKQPPSS